MGRVEKNLLYSFFSINFVQLPSAFSFLIVDYEQNIGLEVTSESSMELVIGATFLFANLGV
jgi:hypothetical protein